MYRLEGGRVREAADVLNRVACLQIRDINFDNLEKHIIDIYAALNYKFKILIRSTDFPKCRSNINNAMMSKEQFKHYYKIYRVRRNS